MILLIIGAFLGFLWAKFNMPTPGSHTKQGFVAKGFNFLWLLSAVSLILIGWIFMVAG